MRIGQGHRKGQGNLWKTWIALITNYIFYMKFFKNIWNWGKLKVWLMDGQKDGKWTWLTGVWKIDEKMDTPIWLSPDIFSHFRNTHWNVDKWWFMNTVKILIIIVAMLIEDLNQADIDLKKWHKLYKLFTFDILEYQE